MSIGIYLKKQLMLNHGIQNLSWSGITMITTLRNPLNDKEPEKTFSDHVLADLFKVVLFDLSGNRIRTDDSNTHSNSFLKHKAF